MLRVLVLVVGVLALGISVSFTGKASTSKGRSPAVVGVVEEYHSGRQPAVVE